MRAWTVQYPGIHIVALFIVLVLTTYIPALVLFLPNLLMGAG